METIMIKILAFVMGYCIYHAMMAKKSAVEVDNRIDEVRKRLYKEEA